MAFLSLQSSCQDKADGYPSGSRFKAGFSLHDTRALGIAYLVGGLEHEFHFFIF